MKVVYSEVNASRLKFDIPVKTERSRPFFKNDTNVAQ